MNSEVLRTDVLVIGSGAAGLSFAIKLSELSDTHSIHVLSKYRLDSGSSNYAQGGVAAVWDQVDSIESHVNDTLVAGAGICDHDAVLFTTSHGRKSIEWLNRLGVSFTKDQQQSNQLHLTKEGGHSYRRIIHAADATGYEIQQKLIEQAKLKDNISFLENHLAVDLLVDQSSNHCIGAYILDSKENVIKTMVAKFVVIATGGASRVYLYSSNPDSSTGDGIAMAYRAGCRVANMEFMQFHPTCLYHPKARNFLISEALRGEGAVLRLSNGEPFMHRFDKRKELAPRDIVARAIDHEIKRLGEPCVYLDISHKSKDFIVTHFPTIYQKCLDLGIDISKDMIPVVPSAHYTCGGVMVNHHGQTDLKNLYAIGEASYTGLHGANRLASNSLLECLVYGSSSAISIHKQLKAGMVQLTKKPLLWDESLVSNSDEQIVISHNWQEIRRFMSDYVGIVRTDKRLERALNRTKLLKKEIDEYYRFFKITPNLIELRNLVLISELVIRSAMSRKESRGLHYNLDYPEQSKTIKITIINPNFNDSNC